MYSYNNIFPLGVLSANQIEKGQVHLNNISKIIDDDDNENELLFLSNEFFSDIPHVLPRSNLKDFIINTHQKINEKNKLLAYMRNF